MNVASESTFSEIYFSCCRYRRVRTNLNSVSFSIGRLIYKSNYLFFTCFGPSLQGKTAEEIRKTFNIVNDFTPEEEAQVREENKWCEDA